MTRARRRAAAIAVAMTAPLLVAACGDDGAAMNAASVPATGAPMSGASGSMSTGSMSTGSTGTGAMSATPAAKSATVVIKGVRFVDKSVTVAVGGTVTFDNQDNQAHTATGDASGGFDTDSVAAGMKGTVTFDRAGTYTYHCAFHPFMVGTVVVA